MAAQSKTFSTNLKDVALGSPLLLSAAAFLVVFSFIRFLLNCSKRLDLPIVGNLHEKDRCKALIEGTAKVSFHLQSQNTLKLHKLTSDSTQTARL